ncbi:MAG: hypothetical protein WD733_18945 [Bryobacterales bacterium]
MRLSLAVVVFFFLGAICLSAQTLEEASPPVAGPVEILPLEEVRPGMQATAWTVFSGSRPEPIPVEIVGVMKNVWGPGQDIIMAKLGGKAQRTNVAGGMSGSPVYYEGKLMGAISLRFSIFSPDAMAGITPIGLMLEINEFDRGRPLQAKLPRPDADRGADSSPKTVALNQAARHGEETGLAAEIWNSVNAELPSDSYITPIETPLTFAGVSNEALKTFEGYFRKAGIVAAHGGAVSAGAGGSTARTNKTGALNPGDAIAAVLISGDMSASGVGTVTYNDGQRVLAFGHSMFNLGPVEIPMAQAEVVTVLASQFAPVKVANSASIVGALRQDRHSGIMGVLGEPAEMIPMHVKVRTFGDSNEVISEKDFNYNIFQNQKWTPPLMVITLFNSMFGLNDFAEETTFRLSGTIDLDGEKQIALDTMQTTTEAPIPAPLLLAGRVGDKVQRVFSNVAELPRFKQMDVTIDLLPQRRLAVVEHAWLEKTDVRPGEEIRGKVFLRPYRGEKIEKSFRMKIPEGASPGALSLIVSDANTLNQSQRMASARNRMMSLSETVTLLNKELSNNQLYISLMQPTVTAHFEDKTLPNVPLSVLNVMKPSSNRRMVLEPQSPLEQISIPFDSIVSGSHAITVYVQ